MLYREIIATCSQIHTKHINKLCGQNAELLNVKSGGKYSNHWAFIYLFFLWHYCPKQAMVSSLLRFLNHTQRHNALSRIPLDRRSARRRDLYLTTHSTHNRHTTMAPVGFEPTIPAGERPQIHALDGAATGTGNNSTLEHKDSCLGFKSYLPTRR